MIRLDKFFTETGTLTRREADNVIKHGFVTVDGKVQKKPEFASKSVDKTPVNHVKYCFGRPELIIPAAQIKKRASFRSGHAGEGGCRLRMALKGHGQSCIGMEPHRPD